MDFIPGKLSEKGQIWVRPKKLMGSIFDLQNRRIQVQVGCRQTAHRDLADKAWRRGLRPLSNLDLQHLLLRGVLLPSESDRLAGREERF